MVASSRWVLVAAALAGALLAPSPVRAQDAAIAAVTSDGPQVFWTAGSDSRAGEFKGRIRLTPADDGRVHVERTSWFADGPGAIRVHEQQGIGSRRGDEVRVRFSPGTTWEVRFTVRLDPRARTCEARAVGPRSTSRERGGSRREDELTAGVGDAALEVAGEMLRAAIEAWLKAGPAAQPAPTTGLAGSVDEAATEGR